MTKATHSVDLAKLAGKRPVYGEYLVMDGEGNVITCIHNFLTYAGASIFAKLVAGTLQASAWHVGMLSGPVNKGDTETAHAWTEPTQAQGYSRQACTISEIVDTTLSKQPATVVVFAPVTFSCGADNEAWDKAYSHSFLAMTDNAAEPKTEVVSIGSQLPSPVRLLPGGNYQTAYRLYFMT